jgi:hypothetical protein
VRAHNTTWEGGRKRESKLEEGRREFKVELEDWSCNLRLESSFNSCEMNKEGGEVYSPHPNPLISLGGKWGSWECVYSFICYCMMLTCYYMLLFRISMNKFVLIEWLMLLMFENGFLRNFGKIIAFIMKWCLMMLKLVLLSLYMLDRPNVNNF